MRWKLIVSLLFIASFLPTKVFAATYYVSPNGTGSCTAASPCSFSVGLGKLLSGDTLVAQSGKYLLSGSLTITTSGVTIKGDTAGGSAVLSGDKNGNNNADATDTPGDKYTSLVYINGSNITFQNFEVAYSGGLGIQINGSNNRISNNIVHNTWSTGIQAMGPNTIIEGNTVYRAADSNYCGGVGGTRLCNGTWGGGIAWGIVGSVNPPGVASGTIIRKNTVYHNSGESLVCMHTDHTTVEDNVSYDNYALGIYIDQCSYVTIQRNLVYYTADKSWWRGSTNPASGISLADEGISTSGNGQYPGGHDRTVINNIVVGAGINFSFWVQGPLAGSALINDLIANNTFVEAQNGYGISIASAPHKNSRFENNIILQSTGLIDTVGTVGGITFSHNLWSRNPDAAVSGTGDIIGNPLLTDPNHTRIFGTTYPYGSVSPDWYTLMANSPAIKKAMVLAEVTNDFFGASRGNPPSIGAHEYGGASSNPTPTTSSPTIGPTSLIGTRLNITLFLHGIGKGGDNVNPQTTGNMNPLRTNRQVTINISNANNQTITKSGTVMYYSAAGNFQGIIDIGTQPTGVYTMRISSPQYLRRGIQGIIQLTGGQNNSLPIISLTTGDINGDNQLNILDYNSLLDCFSDLGAPRNCADANKKMMTDLTDDGAVNQFDYNLFLRELSVQSGQ